MAKKYASTFVDTIERTSSTGMLLGAMSFDLQGTPGMAAGAPVVRNEMQILPAGEFRSTDGRPEECDAWVLTAEIAARVIARAASYKNDILIDFEHQSLWAPINGQRVEAAGWIPRTFEFRDDSGLWATDITWVDDSPELIVKKKVRYVSAVFAYNPKNGHIEEIISVALTNTPALDGMQPLVALARQHAAALSLPQPTRKEASMAGEKDQDQGQAALTQVTQERDTLQTKVTALTQERDTLATANAALTKERDEAKTKVAELEKAQADAAAKAEKDEHAALLEAALTEGVLPPAKKTWAEKQTLASLKEFLEGEKPLAMLNKQAPNAKTTDAHGLTESELAMCSRMGVTPEAYAKAKA